MAIRHLFLTAATGVWGAERSLMAIAIELQRRQEQVHLVCFSQQVAQQWQAAVGAPVTILPNRLSTRRIGQVVPTLRAILRARPDYLHIYTYYMARLLPLLRAVPSRHRPLSLLDVHDYFGGRKVRAWMRVLARSADVVICVSEFCRAQFSDLATPSHVLHRPLGDRDYLHRRAAAAKRRWSHSDSTAVPHGRVGIIGRVVPDKGHLRVIDELASASSDFTLVVRGDAGEQSRDFLDEVVRRGRERLGARFVYEGPVSNDVVMQGLDLLVVGNISEPLGRTVMEAQLEGVVPIVPATGGSVELISPGITGYCYNSAPGSLAELLDKDLADGPGKTMRVRVIESAERQYSTESYVDGLQVALGQAKSERFR